MTETLTVPLSAEAAKRLRELADQQGESLESLASQVLEDMAGDLFGDLGDDEELRRRVADWRQNREGVDASAVHEWLASLGGPNPKERPKPTRR